MRIEENDQAHIYIKNIACLLNLVHTCMHFGHRYGPICSKQVSVEEYDSHIPRWYAYSNNSIILKLPDVGRGM
ncbi:MAG: hypothetical protein ACKPKO_07080 [Candidatus Fonsibacter sp.]